MASDKAKVSETDALDLQKKQIEVEKLSIELQTLKKHHAWYGGIYLVKPNEWIVAATAVLAVCMAFYTGLFDASRQNLAAQGERLEMKKMQLEAEQKELAKDIANKVADLRELRTKLRPYELEQDAVNKLHNLQDIRAIFEVDGDISTVCLTLEGQPARSPDGGFSFPYKARRLPAIHDALKVISQFRNLKKLKIQKCVLADDDLALITSHPSLDYLAVRGCELYADQLRHIQPHKTLRYLDLRYNNIESCSSLPYFDAVIQLSLQHNPVNDAGLEGLTRQLPSLRFLDVSETKITDDAINVFTKIPNLNNLDLGQTAFSKKGVSSLTQCKKLATITIEDAKYFTSAEMQGWKLVPFHNNGVGRMPGFRFHEWD